MKQLSANTSRIRGPRYPVLKWPLQACKIQSKWTISSPISNSSILREKRAQGLSPPEESSRRFSSGETGSAAASCLRTALPGKRRFRCGERKPIATRVTCAFTRGGASSQGGSGADPLQITELTGSRATGPAGSCLSPGPQQQERHGLPYYLRFAASWNCSASSKQG